MKSRENTDQDGRIKATDYDLYKAQERATELAKQADAREFELRRTTEAYEAAAADLMRSRDEQCVRCASARVRALSEWTYQ